MVNLYFTKDDERAIIPSKKSEDAGYDVYMLPEDNIVIIKPGETKVLNTGLKSAFSKDYVLLGRDRGSTGIRGMRFAAGVIDSGYRGVIGIPINNTSDKDIWLIPEKDIKTTYVPQNVTPYSQAKAIGQLLLVPVIDAEVKEITEEEYSKFVSERGTGKLGSSGK